MVLEPLQHIFLIPEFVDVAGFFLQLVILVMFSLLSGAFVVVYSLEHDVPTYLKCCFCWFLLVRIFESSVVGQGTCPCLWYQIC